MQHEFQPHDAWRARRGEQQVAQRVFLQLVRPGQGAEDTRRRALLKELGEGSRSVVQRLTDERLLVTAPGGPVAGEMVEAAGAGVEISASRLPPCCAGRM